MGGLPVVVCTVVKIGKIICYRGVLTDSERVRLTFTVGEGCWFNGFSDCDSRLVTC
jgi:hypothetical protein